MSRDRELDEATEPGEGAQLGALVADFFEMSLDNVCIAANGYFVRVNPSWTRTLGWTAEELMARPILDFVHPDDRDGVLAGRERILRGEPLDPLVNRYRCTDGSYRWFEWRSVASPDRRFVYAAARDITDQKRAKAQLLEAQARQEELQRQLVFADRMSSVGTLAAGVAHEINNPLAYVDGNLNLIIEALRRAQGSEASDLIEMAVEALDGVQRIQSIVAGLKTFSRTDEVRLEVLDPRPLLDLAVSLTTHEIRRHAQLVTDVADLPAVEADDARLAQVFINLIVNAVQAFPTADPSVNVIELRAYTDEAGFAVVEVADNGPGIPSSIVGNVFDPFFTTKPVGVGTGLGLSLCHNIVTSAGGEISVSSAEGEGATFTVRLPPATADVPHEVAAAAPPADVVTRASVLVVDDEPLVGRVLGRLLKEHDVTAVTSALDALALLEEGGRYHIIFSDLMMPEMSGMAFYDELTGRFPSVVSRVVFVSGGAFTPAGREFLDRVPNELLEKPFTPTAVREYVQRYAASYPGR